MASLILRDFSGMDLPFDSQLLMKVAGKTKFFGVATMNFDKEKQEVRDSFNDCLTQFIEADQPKLTDINLCSYVQTPEEAIRFIQAACSIAVEYLTRFTILSPETCGNLDVINVYAEFISSSSKLRNLSFSDMPYTAEGLTIIFNALSQSECLQNFTSLPAYDMEHNESMELVEAVANCIRNNKNFRYLYMVNKNFKPKQAVMILSALSESESLCHFNRIPSIDTGLYSDSDVVAEIAKIMTNSSTLE